MASFSLGWDQRYYYKYHGRESTTDRTACQPGCSFERIGQASHQHLAAAVSSCCSPSLSYSRCCFQCTRTQLPNHYQRF